MAMNLVFVLEPYVPWNYFRFDAFRFDEYISNWDWSEAIRPGERAVSMSGFQLTGSGSLETVGGGPHEVVLQLQGAEPRSPFFAHSTADFNYVGSTVTIYAEDNGVRTQIGFLESPGGSNNYLLTPIALDWSNVSFVTPPFWTSHNLTYEIP